MGGLLQACQARCGDGNRTRDFQIMSLARYLLRHSALPFCCPNSMTVGAYHLTLQKLYLKPVVWRLAGHVRDPANLVAGDMVKIHCLWRKRAVAVDT